MSHKPNLSSRQLIRATALVLALFVFMVAQGRVASAADADRLRKPPIHHPDPHKKYPKQVTFRATLPPDPAHGVSPNDMGILASGYTRVKVNRFFSWNVVSIQAATVYTSGDFFRHFLMVSDDFYRNGRYIGSGSNSDFRDPGIGGGEAYTARYSAPNGCAAWLAVSTHYVEVGYPGGHVSLQDYTGDDAYLCG